MSLDSIFGNFEDLTGTFTVADVAMALVVSFACAALVGWVYRATHRGVSYSQSYVQTLVLLGMLVSLVMLIVGSNIARAFTLVGALSIVRFRNAVKETRDVAFIFFAMAIGMAAGTRFYALAGIATVVIGLVVMVMARFDWYRLDVHRQLVKGQVPADRDRTTEVIGALEPFCADIDLVSAETIRAGALVELVFSVRLRSGIESGAVVAALGAVSDGQKVTVLTGHDRSDL